MSQITWKNVNSKSNNDAAYLMRGAQTAITGGLDRIAGVAQGIEQGRQDDYDQITKNNNDDFKDMLSSYRTTAEFDAARDSGVFADAASSYGSQFDRELGRTGVTNRGDALRDRFTADQGFLTEQQLFKDKQDTRSLRPQLDALAAAQSGTTAADDEEYTRLKTELDANPAFQRLGLNAGLSESWNNSVIAENELRLKTQREDDAEVDRQSNLNFESGIEKIMKNTEIDSVTGYADIPLARAQLVDAMQRGELGPMNNADSQRIIKVLGERMAIQSGLTPAQLQTAEAGQIQAQIQSDKDIALAKTALNVTLAENTVNEEFSFNDSDRSAIDIAMTQGWDEDNLSEKMIATRKKLVKAYGEGDESKNLKPMTGAEADKILALAQAQMGEEDHLFENDDLPTERLYRTAQRYWTEYQTNLKKVENRKNAQDTFTTEEARAKAMPGNSYSTALQTFRTSNLGKKTLVEKQRTSAVI